MAHCFAMDATVGRFAAEATAQHVTGPYTFQVLAGVGHYLTDAAPERVNAALLSHLAQAQPVPATREA